MPEWSALQNREITERRLLDAILDGSFPINSAPLGRELAGMLGVAAPPYAKPQRLSQGAPKSITANKPG